jgi:hypothetical protein
VVVAVQLPFLLLLRTVPALWARPCTSGAGPEGCGCCLWPPTSSAEPGCPGPPPGRCPLPATPDLTALSAGAKKCADTTVDDSQLLHEAAQEQVYREYGG